MPSRRRSQATARWPAKLASSLFAVTLLAVSASPAAANCSPPAGMGIQQWYSICGGALQQAYSQGMGQGLDFDAFVQSMFQVYAQPVMGAGAYGGGGYSGGGGAMMCQPGALQCFNGYVRTCQGMATGGTWWVTGARRC